MWQHRFVSFARRGTGTLFWFGNCDGKENCGDINIYVDYTKTEFMTT